MNKMNSPTKNDTHELQHLSRGPELVIFDIDETLIKPNSFSTIDQIRNSLYDSILLTKMLTDPRYQIAIASYNTDIDPKLIGGRRLGRAILDLYHPTGDSRKAVEDEFIQGWIFKTFAQIFRHRKNIHIAQIIDAYKRKYNRSPPVVYFYDDQIENVYEANRSGAIAFWCQSGLTLDNSSGLLRIGNRVQFKTFGILENWYDGRLSDVASLLRRQPAMTDRGQNIYHLYLPFNKVYAKQWYAQFKELLNKCNVQISVMTTDL